jgi:hypothetical protein
MGVPHTAQKCLLTPGEEEKTAGTAPVQRHLPLSIPKKLVNGAEQFRLQLSQ